MDKKDLEKLTNDLNKLERLASQLHSDTVKRRLDAGLAGTIIGNTPSLQAKRIHDLAVKGQREAESAGKSYSAYRSRISSIMSPAEYCSIFPDMTKNECNEEYAKEVAEAEDVRRTADNALGIARSCRDEVMSFLNIIL